MLGVDLPLHGWEDNSQCIAAVTNGYSANLRHLARLERWTPNQSSIAPLVTASRGTIKVMFLRSLWIGRPLWRLWRRSGCALRPPIFHFLLTRSNLAWTSSVLVAFSKCFVSLENSVPFRRPLSCRYACRQRELKVASLRAALTAERRRASNF